MDTSSPVDEIRAALQRGKRPASLRLIAERADVDYDWLVKFTHGHIGEPGATKIDKVKKALASYSESDAAA
jgi:hypothetical protein